MANKINTTNHIRTFFRFLRYSLICFIFEKNTKTKNKIRNASLDIDIIACEFHHNIPYHKIVTIIWYNAIKIKKTQRNLCIKIVEKQ
jgi:hypothetical protein